MVGWAGRADACLTHQGTHVLGALELLLVVLGSKGRGRARVWSTLTPKTPAKGQGHSVALRNK